MDDPGPELLEKIRPAQLSALLQALYLVACADDEFCDAERRHFGGTVAVLTQNRLTQEQIDAAIQQAETLRSQKDLDSCYAALAEQLSDPDLKEVTLILASDMAAADGVLHPAEQAMLQRMARAFRLSDNLIAAD